MNENNINDILNLDDDEFQGLDELLGEDQEGQVDDSDIFDISDEDFADLNGEEEEAENDSESNFADIDESDFGDEEEYVEAGVDIDDGTVSFNDADINESDLEDEDDFIDLNYGDTDIGKNNTVVESETKIEDKPLKRFEDLTEDEINNLTADELERYLAQSNEDDEDNVDGEEFETLSVEDESEDGYDTTSADNDGAILDTEALVSEDDFDTVDRDAGFLSNNGEIVVMDESENGENFRFQYIDIENIAIVKRIRKTNTNVEDLVKSIKSTGLLEPLVVAPTETEGIYVLLAGFRRIIACAKAGKRKIPCIVNIRASVPEIPVLEALYNHSKSYTIKEVVDYIDYLEKQKGIMSASMIEYLLQLNSGDYTKLKDILNDNDDDIVSKLYDGIYTIEAAFKKLEQRRKKESAEEKENKKAAKVYEDGAESGADKIEASGEDVDDGDVLTDEEIRAFAFNASDIDDAEDEDLSEMIEESNNIEGFKPNKQDYRDRERLDPTLRKSVLTRDKNTCRFCGMGGQEYQEVMDVHHLVEVYLGGDDSIDNLITACTCCHKLIHLFGRGELYIRPMDELSDSEQTKFKKIVKAGNLIREGMAAKGLKKEQLKRVDNADTIGRTKPGTGQVAG